MPCPAGQARPGKSRTGPNKTVYASVSCTKLETILKRGLQFQQLSQACLEWVNPCTQLVVGRQRYDTRVKPP
eukprot:7428065-Pyramimonas_sp.AAC.2